MTPKINVLVAYPYLMDKTGARILDMVARTSEHVRLLIDSGAFTAWKSGSAIELDDYCRFLEKLPVKPWRYFSLDVIGDPAKTLENYDIMRRRGFTPLPIFTRGEDVSILDEYYATSDVVGVGGLVGTKGNRGFVRGIMRHIGDRRVHWLGFTAIEFVKAYRPYMCDSSSWESGARYGQVKLYMGNARFRTFKKLDCENKLDDEILQRISELKMDPYRMARLEQWHGGYSSSRRLSARNSVAFSVDVEKMCGTKLFLALASSHAYDLIYEGFREIYLGEST